VGPCHRRCGHAHHAVGGVSNPHFTTNPDRIFAYSRRDGLASFRWDGTDFKSHIKVTGPMPPTSTVGDEAMTLDAASS